MQNYSDREIHYALRFYDTMTQFGYWDIPVKALRHLIRINLIDHAGCGKYSVSENLVKLAENQIAASETAAA